MKYRTLGGTGFTVSVVGVGTWQFGGEWGKKFEQDEVNRMFDEARRQGINLIDTAECYGDHRSEELIGEAIREDRDDWIVATKFGHYFHDFMDRTTDFRAEGMVKQLDNSLQALQTDYIDVFQFHKVSREIYRNDDLWAAVEKQKEKGKIRAIGVSIGHEAFPLRRREVETVQVIHNRLNRGAEEEVLPLAREKGFGVLSRVPLASGLLSGKYREGQRWPEDDVRSLRDDDEQDRRLREVQRIRQEEVPDGVDMAPWALSWSLKHPAVTAVIPGCKSVEQVRSNASAADLDIGQDEHPQAVEAAGC